ncbi:MAG: hypothetical protein RIB32_03600 [Phycisphaerales bacterium]
MKRARRSTGFVMLYVLLLLLISTTVIGMGLRRSAMQSRITQMRVDGYHEHHELMSIVDIVEWWLDSGENATVLADLQETGEDQRAVITLSGDITLELFLSDDQGTILARRDRTASEAQMDWLFNALTTIGEMSTREEIDAMTRKIGPFRVSFRAIRDERILHALADGDDDLLDALNLAWRDPSVTNQTEFERIVQSEDVSRETVRRLTSQFITFQPTLIRVNVALYSPYMAEETRYYSLLLEKRERVVFYEWRKASGLTDASPVEGVVDEERRRRSRSER